MLDVIKSFGDTTELRLFLCKPDRTTISELYTAYGINSNENYGGINQLSFKLPYRIKVDMKYVRNFSVDITNGDYLIRLERHLSIPSLSDGAGFETEYYIINSYTNEYSNGTETRTVNCNMQPYELSYKVLYYYKETKPLYDFIGHNSILHDTLLALSDYTIGYCNAEIGIQYRAVEINQTDLLSFLNQMANTFNLIVTFDSVNKTVSFSKETELGNDLGVTIDDSNLKSIGETENHAEIITKLYCEGNNKLTFASISPTGETSLEDYSFYMRGYTEDSNGVALTHTNGYMSDSLCHAMIVYNKKVADSGTTFSNLIAQRATLVTSKIPYTKIDTQYNIDMDLINANIDLNIKNGISLSVLNGQKTAKQAQIDSNKAILTGIDAQIATTDTSISALQSSLSMSSNFTMTQIIEKKKYTRERVWIDTKFVDPKDLYASAAIRLKNVSQPIFQLQCEIVDITSQLNDSKDWNKVKIGSIVTVRFTDFEDTSYVKAKIINLSYSADDRSLKVTIANSKDIKSGFLKFADLLNKSVSTSAMIDFNSGDWALGKNANDTVNQILKNKWDAVKNAIVGGVNENAVLDGRGITLTTPSDTKNYLRAVHNVIAFTNDGGLTFKNALTSTGLVAESIIGNIIAGNNLLITNQSGTFTVNGAGVTISGANLTVTGGIPSDQIQGGGKFVNLDTPYDNIIISSLGNSATGLDKGISAIDSAVKSKTIMNSGGFKIQKNTGTTANPVWSTQLFTDVDGNLSITGAITATSGVFNGTVNANAGNFSGNITATGTITGGDFVSTRLSSAVLTGGSINIGNGKFTVDSAGNMSATSASLSGNITMSGGSITWGSVNPPTASQVGALPVGTFIPVVPSYITSTKITSTTIESPTISAGTITGATIQTAQSGGRLVLSGNTLQSLNGSTQEGVQIYPTLGSTGGYLGLYYAGSSVGSIFGETTQLNITANGSPRNLLLQANSGYIRLQSSEIQIGGTMRCSDVYSASNIFISGQPVATQAWVSANAVGTAKFA